MTRMPHNHWVALFMVLALVLSIFLPSHKMIDSTGKMLPSWGLALNLLVQPLLVLLVVLPGRMRAQLRLLLLVLFLCSLSLNRLSWDTHPLATAAVLGLVYVEAFWIIPKWNSRRAGGQQRSP